VTAEAASGTGGAFLGVERSISGKSWRLREADEAGALAIARALDAPEALGRILSARGVTPDIAQGFLKPTLKGEFPDPSSFADMDCGAARIADEIEKGGPIGIFADYDVDGASSAAQLIRYLRPLGVETPIYVPDRAKEGYGPTGESLLSLKAKGCGAVITVDCGAAAYEALEAAAEGGLDVVVLDHHLMQGEPPRAAAMINPNRVDCASGQGHLAAAGVTFIFLAALARELRRRDYFKGRDEPDILSFLDLAALGTVCDIVPLTGVNRAIVAQGARVMSAQGNTGLKALAESAGASPPFAEYHAGFIFGPRINAGGRIGDSSLGARLLSTDDAEEARQIAGELERLNTDRKAIETAVVDEASLAADRSVVSDTEPAVIVASGEGWPPGVVGLAASRLVERYGRPAVVIGIEGDGLGRGSGRSIKGVNLGGAISDLRKQGLLESGGGHAMAAGLSIRKENIPAFESALSERLAGEVAAATATASLCLDALISPSAANLALVEVVQAAGPFGPGNPQPLFAFSNLRVAYAERVGGAHVRAAFEDSSGLRLNAIAFRVADTPVGEALLNAGDRRVNLAARLKLDEWNGRRRVDAHVVDLAWR